MLLLVPGLLLFRLHACRYLGQEKTVGAASRVDAVDRHARRHPTAARRTILGWTPDLDDEWWKPHDKKEALCMQPKNDYFGSQIVAGKCKKHNSKQQWEIVGEKVRKAEQ